MTNDEAASHRAKTAAELAQELRGAADMLPADALRYADMAVLVGQLAVLEHVQVITGEVLAVALARTPRRGSKAADLAFKASAQAASGTAQGLELLQAMARHQHPLPAEVLGAPVNFAVLAAYHAGYAQAMADQSEARRQGAKVRRPCPAAERLAAEIEQAARSSRSAASLAEKLGPKHGKTVRHMERLIGAARKRARHQ